MHAHGTDAGPCHVRKYPAHLQSPSVCACTSCTCIHSVCVQTLGKSAGSHVLHAGMCVACAGEHTMCADNSTCCTGNQMTGVSMGTNAQANTQCVQTTYLTCRQARCSWVQKRSISRLTHALCIFYLQAYRLATLGNRRVRLSDVWQQPVVWQ